MGARGPRPTPTKVLEERGSWRAKDRADAGGPLFPLERPTCPSWLAGEAKAEWKRIVSLLITAGLVSKASRATLAAYCVSWAEMREAEMELATEGKVLTTEKGYRYASPWVAIARNARADVCRLASEFGMTPASSGKVQVSSVAEPDGSGEEQKFFGTVG